MNITDCRIGMKVNSMANASCTYEIVAIYADGSIDVLHRNSGNRYYNRSCRIFYPAPAETPAPIPTLSERILSDVSEMLKRGTSFACFDYNGKRRHVLIGANVCENYPRWGNLVNRAIVKHNGKTFLVAIDKTDDDTIKNFDIAKIENWMKKFG